MWGRSSQHERHGGKHWNFLLLHCTTMDIEEIADGSGKVPWWGWTLGIQSNLSCSDGWLQNFDLWPREWRIKVDFYLHSRPSLASKQFTSGVSQCLNESTKVDTKISEIGSKVTLKSKFYHSYLHLEEQSKQFYPFILILVLFHKVPASIKLKWWHLTWSQKRGHGSPNYISPMR